MTAPMIRFHTLDVFTDTPFAGNPLAVVLDAGALTTAQMQTIAREFNLSETIFVMPPQDPAHTARVRIFFPTAEIPFAGHPTIGCAILLAETANPGGDFAITITLEEEAGLVPVAVTRTGGRITAELTAPVLPHPAGDTPDTALLAAALGLGAKDIGPHRAGPGACVSPSATWMRWPGPGPASRTGPRPLHRPGWTAPIFTPPPRTPTTAPGCSALRPGSRKIRPPDRPARSLRRSFWPMLRWPRAQPA